MGSELDITVSNLDIDAFLSAIRVAALIEDDLNVQIREEHFEGLATTIWGRRLPADDSFLWEEANEEVASGLASIETIIPADGSPLFNAVVYYTPYRELTLAALRKHGEPIFDYASNFVIVDIRWGQGAGLTLGFDRQTRATGRPEHQWPSKWGVVTHISCVDDYVGRDSEHRTAADHMRAVAITDLLGQYGTLSLYDTTGYAESRNEIALIGAMALDRQFRADLRNAFADLVSSAVQRPPFSGTY